MAGRPLSADLLAMQLATVDVLGSMFCLPGELTMSPADTATVDLVRSYTESASPSSEPPAELAPSISFTVNLTFECDVEQPPKPAGAPLQNRPNATPQNRDLKVELEVTLPLTATTHEAEAGDDVPPPRVSMPCPAWMDREAYTALVESLPTGEPDCVLPAIDYVRDAVAAYVEDTIKPAAAAAAAAAAATAAANARRRATRVLYDDDLEEGLIRVWFYFPSLSTREKRADLVNWAPGYKLTGFVLAGKPGVLCLEGTSSNIDSYMSAIKTQSWADIPSFQKKVSEKWRERTEVRRAFDSMTEITNTVPMHGARGNRGELSEVERMLEEKGLGHAFARVFL